MANEIFKRNRLTCLASALLASAFSTHALAQPATEFYKGKTVTIAVGASAGGGVDLFARLVGRHLGRFVPGTPTLVVQKDIFL